MDLKYPHNWVIQQHYEERNRKQNKIVLHVSVIDAGIRTAHGSSFWGFKEIKYFWVNVPAVDIL